MAATTAAADAGPDASSTSWPRATTAAMLLVGVCAVTSVASAPYSVGAGELTELHLPDASWTLPQLRAALEDAGIPVRVYTGLVSGSAVVVALTWFAVAALVLWRRPRDDGSRRVAVLMALAAWSLTGAPTALEALWPDASLLVRLAGAVTLTALPVLVYVFPDGRFVPGWSRWTALVTVAVSPLHAFAAPVDPDSWPEPLASTLFALAVGLPVLAQVVRYRRHSGPTERRQVRWVVASVVAVGVAALLPALVATASPALTRPGPSALWFVLVSNLWLTAVVLLVPLAIGSSLLRLGLWQAEPVLRRSLVLGAVTVALATVYALVVAGLVLLFSPAGSLLFAALATGVVAVVLAPVRTAAERLVDRILFGRREDAWVVVTRLARRLEEAVSPEELLGTVAGTLREALGLPWARVELRGVDDEPPTPVGGPGEQPDDGPVVRVPLVHHGDHVADLVVPRPADGVVRPRDRALLQELALHAGAAVSAARASAELRRAHDRLATAREEERRRLSEDLHDVLGPMLATVAVQLDLAAGLPPGAAEQRQALAEAHDCTQDTLALARRLAHSLYHPVVGQLGLTGAVREHATSLLAPAGVAVDLDLPAEPPVLPARVEMAAFLVVAEAVTNVARHAGARRCRVTVRAGTEDLCLEVVDDGRGPDAPGQGLGLRSMRRRAEELGGTLDVSAPATGGTVVRARLPVGPA